MGLQIKRVRINCAWPVNSVTCSILYITTTRRDGSYISGDVRTGASLGQDSHWTWGPLPAASRRASPFSHCPQPATTRRRCRSPPERPWRPPSCRSPRVMAHTPTTCAKPGPLPLTWDRWGTDLNHLLYTVEFFRNTQKLIVGGLGDWASFVFLGKFF